MTEQKQPKRWAEVVAKPEFQALEPMERERMRHQYFDEIVAPQTTAANYSQAWEEFDAHSQQVLGQAFGSANPASAEPETEGPGIVGNTGRRIADRASDLVGNLGIGIGKAAEAGGDFAADVTGINPGVVWGDGQGLRFTMNMPDDVNDIGDAMQSQGEAVRDYDAGYQPNFTWERLKGDLSVGNLAGYIVEQGGGSIPDMIAAVTMLPAYIASRTEEVADERATNDGREAPGGRDYAVAAPTAVAMSVLERLGAKGILGEKEVGTAMDLLKETGRAAGKEAGTEFVQEGMEYTATTAGTETGYDPVTMLDRGAAGAVAGGGIGGVGRVATGGAEMAGVKQTEQGRQTRAEEARRAAEQADIDFEVKMRQLQESMRGDFEPNAPRIEGAQAVPEADFYAGTDGTVTAEQQTQREMPQAGPEAQQQPQGFGIQREPVAEPQPSLAPEGITFEDWDDANDAITFDESDIEPEIANIAEMAEFAGMVGVPRQAIESALSLNDEQETISALEDMVATAQAEMNQPEVTPDAVDPRAESQNPEQAGQPEPALRDQPENRPEAAGIPRASESGRTENGAEAAAEPGPELTPDPAAAAAPVVQAPEQIEPTEGPDSPDPEPANTPDRPDPTDPVAEFERDIRQKASEFSGTYDGRPLAPLAEDIANSALTDRRRLSEGEVTALAEKHDVPESVVQGLTGQPWSWDGVLAFSEAGNEGAQALRNRTPEPAEVEAPKTRAQTVRDKASARAASEAAPETLPADDDLVSVTMQPIAPTPATPAQDIDAAANEAATSPTNDLPEPTEAQKEAGNYKKGHVNIQGLDVSIENPKGSTRRGTDPDGNEWSVEMKAHYGDVRGTQGADGDAVDVFIGPNPESDQVFVVDQVNADGTFDEHKALIGWDTEQEAREAYAANYDDGWKVGPVTAMSMDEFKGWLESGNTRKPLNQKEPTRAERVREKARARAKKKEPTSAKPEVIADIGEKIGGARKDTDIKTGSGKSRRKSEGDSRPAWARRYEISQIVELQGVPDGGRFVVHDKRTKDRFGQTRRAVQKTFATEVEAEAMLPMIEVGRNHTALSTREGKYEIWRKISDRKRVKVVAQQFDDRQAAMQYMAENATDIIETKTTFGEGDIPSPPDRARTGPERRQGDVKGQDFMDAFGFRGVEFGNWNNQEERQDLLNDAFDALMDLAEIIGIPSKAIGLNGDLALAFGARGQGLSGARAHYEPDRAVINLTKVNGAGSLAHEWFHALDHYFGRQDGKASSVWTSKEGGSRLKTRGAEDFASHGFRRKDSGVREEVREAYAKMIKTLFGKAETYVEETRKADEFVGRVKKELEYNLESLRNDLAEQKDPKYYKRKNQPASAEQLAEFDTIAQQFLNGQGLETEVRSNPSGRSRSSMRLTNDSLEALSDIYKSVRGRSGFDGTNQRGALDRLRATMSNYHQRLEMMANAQEGKEKVRRVPTDFTMNAKELDQGRGTDYWTTPHEMIARAFQGYIEDKVADQGNVSRFLNYGPEGAAILTPWGLGYPFPKGKERIRINESIDDFITSLKTKEEGSGVVLYSLSDPSKEEADTPAQPTKTEAANKANKQPAAGGISASEAQSVADRLNDKMPGIVTVVQSVEELPARYKFMRQAGTSRGPRGFFDPETNEVFLIADNIKDSAEAERTYLHEVVGHFGIRLAFGNELNGYLDRLYKQIPTSKLKPFMDRYGLKEHKAADRRVAVEEYIAHTAELNGRKPHWFKRLIARVRDWLRSVGVVKEWTNDDIYALIAQSNNPTVDTMLAQSMASLSNLRRQMDSADDNVRLAMTDDGQVTAEEEADSALGMLYGFAYAGHTVYPVNPGATNAETLFRHYGYEGDIDADAAVNVTGQYNPVSAVIGKTPNSGRGNFDFKIVDTESALPYAVIVPAASARQGVALYQAAMDWAHNNGKKLRPDPVGLTPVNYLRRSEAMLASMMRNGTSRHLEPDYTQFDGFLNESDLVDGTEIEEMALLKQFKDRLWGNEGQGSAGEAVARANAHNMAAASLALTLRRKPELLKYRADSQGNIYEAAPNARAKPAKVAGPESALEWIADQITMADVANGVGARTALRAILAQSALLGPNGPRDIAGAISAITDTLALFHKGQVEKMPARALLPDVVIRRMARAYSNEGSQQQRIYYSLKDPESPRTVDDIINLKHQTPLARAVSWASKQGAGLTGQKYGALTLRQLSEISRMTLPHIKAYVATIHRMMTRRNQMAEDAVTIANDVQKWAARNAAEADTLFDLMHEATLAEVDPAEPFVSRKDMLNDRVKVLTERIKNVGGESAQSGRKKRLTDELADIKKQIKDEPRREINHNRLSPIWEKLSPAAKKHYKTMKVKYEQRHEIFMKLMEARIQNADIEQHVKRQMIAEMRYEFESNTLGGVYFPLARFGDYWVETNDENGERLFTTYESERDQKRVVKELTAANMPVTSGKFLQGSGEVDGVSLGFVQEVMETIDSSNVNEQLSSELGDAVYQLYLQALPTRSMRKNFIHRKGVQGFHRDAIRTFADNMMKGSHQLARLEYQDELSDLMVDMKKAAQKGSNTAADLYNEMVKRHEWVMNPANSTVAQKLTSIGFIWMLGITPAAALVNTTQNMVVALPVLASKFGWAAASKELVKTSGEFLGSIPGAVTDRVKGEKEGRPWSIRNALQGAEREAYDELVDLGVIDVTMAHNLAGIAETDAYRYSDTGHKVMSVVSYLFHKAEVYNRETSGIAAYRLAKASGMDHPKAVQYAADAVWDSHFDYTNTNRARFMQPNWAKVAFQFKQYSQNITYYLVRNAKRAMYDPALGMFGKQADTTKEEQREAAVQLAGTLGITLGLGGITTMPMIGVLNSLTNMLLDDDEDEPFDAETEVKQWIVDKVGQDLGERIIWGAGGAGLSSRVTLDGLWVRDPYRDMMGEDLWTHYAQQAMGPVIGGVFVSAFRGVQDISEGRPWTGVEKFLPKAFKDASKAVRYHTEGATTRQGYQLKEDWTFGELALQGLGIADHDLMKRYDANSAIRSYDIAIANRKSALLSQYYQAYSEGDDTLRKETMAAIRRFNEKNPTHKISRASIQSSIRTQVRNSRTNEAGMRMDRGLRSIKDRITYGD